MARKHRRRGHCRYTQRDVVRPRVRLERELESGDPEHYMTAEYQVDGQGRDHCFGDRSQARGASERGKQTNVNPPKHRCEHECRDEHIDCQTTELSDRGDVPRDNVRAREVYDE